MSYPKPNDLNSAILFTVAWFDLFKHPLTVREVYNWLFGYKANFLEVELALKEHPHLTSYKKGDEIYYSLRGRENLVGLRLARESTANKFMQRVDRFKHVFAHLPHIKMVAVVNTLAFGFPDKDSDIDLFIITSKNRIWSARLSVTGALHLRRVRRHHDNVAGRFCLSFFTTEDNLDFRKIMKKPFDPYLAKWILTMNPIFDEDNYASKFWEQNLWAREYFPNFAFKQRKEVVHRSGIQALIVRLRELLANRFVEKSVRSFLLPRAQKKYELLSSEHDTIISDQMLKFHESNARRELYRNWKKNLREIDPKSVDNLK